MKLTCPACGSLSSLDALLGNEGAREAVMAVLGEQKPHGNMPASVKNAVKSPQGGGRCVPGGDAATLPLKENRNAEQP